MGENKNIEIGKYTLESLTTGMYSDPKIVYREYIQNSVDSLEEAVNCNLLEKQCMRIDIIINEEESTIKIKDNGVGITVGKAQSTLLNIGNSQKRHNNNRGFRGIGRLGGMSYCEKLIFTTSAYKENKKTTIEFNCKRLRELLIPGKFEDYNLSAVLEEITKIRVTEEKFDNHYFIVEMIGVSDFSDLLYVDEVKKYISQVAPVPYRTKSFVYASEIHSYISKYGFEVEEFPIFVGADYNDLQPIYKPNRHRFHADRNKKRDDDIQEIKFFDIIINDELFAIGWYASCEWLGTISEPEISGLRVRKGNILIGDSKTMNQIYKENRFNGWVQGEIFVVTDKLIPNARRDDFEQNSAYYEFIDSLKEGIGSELTKLIRDASFKRNEKSEKIFKEIEKEIKEAQKQLEEGFNSSVDKQKVIEKLSQGAERLEETRVKEDNANEKNILIEKVEKTIEDITESKNFKINKVNTGIDKKSKKILEIVSNILSEKLAKFLVDEIIDEIINRLNKK